MKYKNASKRYLKKKPDKDLTWSQIRKKYDLPFCAIGWVKDWVGSPMRFGSGK